MEELTMEDLRNLLGVEDGKLENYRNLNIRAIQPALLEVNSYSPFDVAITPKKKGKKVVSFLMGWNLKGEDALREAYLEQNRHSAGRKARATGTTEHVNAYEDILENKAEQQGKIPSDRRLKLQDVLSLLSTKPQKTVA